MQINKNEQVADWFDDLTPTQKKQFKYLERRLKEVKEFRTKKFNVGAEK